MKPKQTPIVLLLVCLITVSLAIFVGQNHRVIAQGWANPSVQLANQNLGLLSTCRVQPETNKASKPELGPEVETPAALYRFRRAVNWQNSSASFFPQQSGSAPREYQALANRTNYGQRYLYDLNGKPANHTPIVVLHETAIDANRTIQFFQTYHAADEDQASYHTLITRTGDVVYIVPPDLRAFGAGNSVFEGELGTEVVQTNPGLPGSVNNFAYHVSLESPPDGYHSGSSHSGYTREQYQSLAWLVARTGVPDNRITTHQAVDRSGERADPRNFDTQLFSQLLRSYPKTQEIVIGCNAPSVNQ